MRKLVSWPICFLAQAPTCPTQLRCQLRCLLRCPPRLHILPCQLPLLILQPHTLVCLIKPCLLPRGATPLDHPMSQLSINEATLANIVREEVTASVEHSTRSLRQRQGGSRYREGRPMQRHIVGVLVIYLLTAPTTLEEEEGSRAPIYIIIERRDSVF